MSAEFSIGEFTFKVDNLKVKTSLHVFKKLAKTILPAVAEAKMAGADKIGDALDRVVDNLDSIDDLFDAFVPVTQYTGPGRDNMTALKPLVEHVFGGRPEVMLEYVAMCVKGEFGNFLKESGLLAPMAAKMKAAGLL